MVSILLIRAGQDIALRPLASFLQPVWNSLNRLPLHRWLQSDYDDQYRNRMHALGNIVVPAGGKLDWIYSSECLPSMTWPRFRKSSVWNSFLDVMLKRGIAMLFRDSWQEFWGNSWQQLRTTLKWTGIASHAFGGSLSKLESKWRSLVPILLCSTATSGFQFLFPVIISPCYLVFVLFSPYISPESVLVFRERLVNFHLCWFTKKGPHKSPKNSVFPVFYERFWDLWGPFLGTNPSGKLAGKVDARQNTAKFVVSKQWFWVWYKNALERLPPNKNLF